MFFFKKNIWTNSDSDPAKMINSQLNGSYEVRDIRQHYLNCTTVCRFQLRAICRWFRDFEVFENLIDNVIIPAKLFTNDRNCIGFSVFLLIVMLWVNSVIQ